MIYCIENSLFLYRKLPQSQVPGSYSSPGLSRAPPVPYSSRRGHLARQARHASGGRCAGTPPMELEFFCGQTNNVETEKGRITSCICCFFDKLAYSNAAQILLQVGEHDPVQLHPIAAPRLGRRAPIFLTRLRGARQRSLRRGS